MWRLGVVGAPSLGLVRGLARKSACDADASDAPSIMEQADAAVEAARYRVSTPMQFETLKLSLNAGRVNTFDGLRFTVQKQVNLNTAVSHFFWIGSQQAGNIYQYRIIIPFDDKSATASVDPDGNLEGETKYMLSPSSALKTNFALSSREHFFKLQLESQDASSASLLEYSVAASNSIGLSYMQTVYPSISLGGSGQFDLTKRVMSTAIGGVYDDGINSLTAVLDKQLQLLYIRKVNPNRVHLSSDLVFNPDGTSQMSVAAEYTLKQSTLHISLDSNLVVKSMLDVRNVIPGANLQLCGEMNHIKDSHRFGVGFTMG